MTLAVTVPGADHCKQNHQYPIKPNQYEYFLS